MWEMAPISMYQFASRGLSPRVCMIAAMSVGVCEAGKTVNACGGFGLKMLGQRC